MSRFEEICYKMNELTYWVKTAIFVVVYALMLLWYVNCIEGLQKPGGFIEALDFLFSNPQEYIIALLTGAILQVLPWLLGASVIFALIATFLFGEERKIVLNVIDGVFTVVMVIINKNMVHHVGVLAFVCACACIIVYAFVEGSNR